MAAAQILTDEFAESAVIAGLRARTIALASGHPVVFKDEQGRYIEELPDGTKFEIRVRQGTPRDSHLEILGQLSNSLK